MSDSPTEVTYLLAPARRGEADAVDRLFPLIYDELKRIARAQMQRERPDHTLQPTALVHEAYLKLVRQSDASYDDRTHFFRVAAQAIRRILIDQSPARRPLLAHKHPLNDDPAQSKAAEPDYHALDRAMKGLAREHPECTAVVELRYYAGLSECEVAQTLNLGLRTVQRHWKFARAWLQREMNASTTSTIAKPSHVR